MYYAAIDPMAMILSGTALRIWYDIHHPHEIKVADILTVLKDMSTEEQRATINRAKTMVAYGTAVEQAAAELAR